MSYAVLVMRPGNRLRDMRKAAGLTQAELADRVGASQEALSNYENGRRPLTLEWMRIFARELRCNVADLLDDADNPDRLDAEERELVHRYRSADELQREMIGRVAAPAGYRGQEREDRAA
jgi:transcriptional regulator with XRE-family HTH domain